MIVNNSLLEMLNNIQQNVKISVGMLCFWRLTWMLALLWCHRGDFFYI